MKYKGYVAPVQYDEADSYYYGIVANISDVIHFEGESPDEAKKAFHDSVDEYLDSCARHNRKPEKPNSGRLSLRMDPALHHKLVAAAQQRGESVGEFVTRTLQHALHVS